MLWFLVLHGTSVDGLYEICAGQINPFSDKQAI
jgi:hypothetical protein